MKNLISIYQNLNPLTKKVIIFVLANILIIKPLLILISVISGEDIYLLLKGSTFLFPQFLTDSWIAMKNAFEFFANPSTELIYNKVFFTDHVKFQYPLTSLLFYLPVAGLEQKLRFRVLNFIGVIFIILTVLFINRIFLFILQQQSVNKLSKLDILTLNILLPCFTLTFYPVVRALLLGQIQVWINALFTICVYYWLREKKNISGLLIGVICLIKPQYALIIIWGVIRKQWNFVFNSLIILSAGWIISIIIFGAANNFNYFTVLSFISKHGESFYANQSFNGLLNRALFNGNNLVWEANSFPPFNYFVDYGTLITSLIFISLALFYPLIRKDKGNIINFLVISLSATIASPVAWEHHYGILLSIYTFLFAYLLKKKSKNLLLLISTSYVLTSNFLPFIDKKTHNTSFNFLQSYLFFGGLMVLVCLYLLVKNYKDNKNFNSEHST